MEAAQARLSLHLSKCYIVWNHMSRLNYFTFYGHVESWTSSVKYIWTVTCDFQQCGMLASLESDEPVQPPFKLRNSKWCSASSLTFIKYASDFQRLWSDCVCAQVDLRLCWSHIPHCWKSHGTALFFLLKMVCLGNWLLNNILSKVIDRLKFVYLRSSGLFSRATKRIVFRISFMLLWLVLVCWSCKMSRDMRFPTMWHFDKFRHRQVCTAFFLSLETPNDVQSVAYHS